MSYFLIENFKSGLDVRKSMLTAPAGTLTRLVNASITPGGEIQKRRAFVKVATLTGTFGLAAIGNKLVTFTKNTNPTNPGIKDPTTGASPTDVTLEYHRLPNTSASAVLSDFDIFDGRLYVVLSDPTPTAAPPVGQGATLPTGVKTGDTYNLTSQVNTIKVWRGTYWADWEANKRSVNLPARGFTDDYYHNLTEGKWYKITGGDWLVQTAAPSNAANWPSGAGCPSPSMEGATFFRSGDAKNFITQNRLWVPFTPTFSVSALPTTYPNGTTYKNTTDGKTYYWNDTAWVEWTVTAGAQNPHYYLDDREKVNDQLIQNLDLTWTWTTKDNPNKGTYQETEGSGKGLFIRSYKSKMYCVGDKYLRFSAVDNAFYWTPATDANDTSRTGAGFVNVSLQEGGSSQLKGVEIYYDKLALLSELSTQIWSVVSDPKQNSLGQVLRQTGTHAPWSVQQFGSGDIMFLHSSGIRSLKARDISNAAAVSDIGSPVDDYVSGLAKKYGSNLYLHNCRSILEPIFGRVWFAFPTEIMVLSFFPGPNITAWSTYTVPFTIDHIVVVADRIFVRSGNDLYLFGGVNGETYDTTPVEVRLPYLDGSKPGHMKMFQAIDATVWGTWDVKISYNYDLPNDEEHVATVSSPTWNKGRYELTGFASHMSLRFYNNTAEKAQIANAAIHYNMASDAD